MNFFEGIFALFSTSKYMDMLLEGLGTTLLISVAAAVLGLLLGTIVALINLCPSNPIMWLPKTLSKIYVTIIRGTPMALQLYIMFYVIFTFRGFPETVTAIIAFGINSGAYVAEIFRGGIMSIDKGQMEAGRSIGMSYGQTMWHIIAPQVIKNVLPTLCNEFITLIKETSIAFNLGVSELTNAGDRIRGQTYSPFMPLIAVALIYLVIVVILTKLVGILERRLRQSDAR